MSSTRAALVYALEPVWAGMFGYLVGERLSAAALVGCGLILMGIVASVLRFSAIARAGRKRKEKG
jgi:drug/metabolite transporter (DMT)-like permease